MTKQYTEPTDIFTFTESNTLLEGTYNDLVNLWQAVNDMIGFGMMVWVQSSPPTSPEENQMIEWLKRNLEPLANLRVDAGNRKALLANKNAVVQAAYTILTRVKPFMDKRNINAARMAKIDQLYRAVIAPDPQQP
jgi:hypothetical protein